MEKKEGYDPVYSAGVNIASAPTGMLIPPSNLMIVYSTIAGSVSVAALFTGGYVPGILWGLLVMFLAGVKAKKCGYVAERRIPAKMTGIITFMIGLSSIMSWVMAFTGLPDLIANGMLSITENRYVILILMNIILLIVGTFMDPTPAVLIFTPIFLPIAESLGMSSIQFGVMLIFNMCMGSMTPPVGSVLFVSCGISKITIEQVTKTLLPYFAVLLGILLAVTYIPALSMAVPTLLGLV